MFEKEAEKYANRFWGNKESLDRACTIDNFKDGAEFGYNKAKEEYAIKLKEVVETCNHWQEVAEKVTEWHYVNWKYFADKDYPESETASYLVQLRNKDTLICDWETEEGFGCFYDDNLEPIDNDDVYAWKEIVLPELKEIKEK